MLNYYGIKDSCLLCDGNPWYDWQFLAPHCKCKRKPCDHNNGEQDLPEQDEQEPKDPCCEDSCCGSPCCGNPCCKKPCPCIKKANELEEQLKDLKSDVARNTQTIKNNYDYFSELISDLAIKEQKDVDDLWAALRQEITDRTDGDNALWDALNQEIADRTAADAAEQAAREQADADEAAAREAADNDLQDQITDNKEAIEAEVIRSTAMDIQLGQDIAEVSDRLDDALGIDAQGLEAIIRVLEDHDTATGIAVQIGDLYENKKDKQTPVSDPTSSGNTLNFIDTISQNENGDITVTKKKLQYSEAYVDASHTGKDGIITAQEKARLDNAKQIQTAVSDPTSSGNTLNFIDTISQNENGDITVTKKKLQYSEAYVDASHTGKDGIITAQEKARLDNAKQIQTAVSDPSVPSTGTTESISFIDTITQNTNGDITPTKKEVRYATTSAKGVVTLADSISSSDTTAATPGAVEDYVSDIVSGLDASVTSIDGTNVQVKVTETDGKVTGVNITTDDTINATDLSNAINALDATVTGNGTNVNVTVTETDGIITGVSVVDNSINSGDLSDTISTLDSNVSDSSTNVTVSVTQVDGILTGINVSDTAKTIQNAIADPIADGNSTTFIDSITQNANGEITATKKNVNFGVLSDYKTKQTTVSDPSSTSTITIGSKDDQNNVISSFDVITGISQDANGVITPTKVTIDLSGVLTAISNLTNRIDALEGYWTKTLWYGSGNNAVYKLTTPYAIEPEGYR